jgi:tetratricopeptide (TPR) repeat protein
LNSPSLGDSIVSRTDVHAEAKEADMATNRVWVVSTVLLVVVAGILVGCTPNVSKERSAGIALYEEQRHIDAMATFRHCLLQRPNDAESNYYMGLCYRSVAENKLREGDIAGANRELDTALIYYNQAIREWPNYDAAIRAQNDALELRGKPDVALARAQQISSQNRPDPRAQIFLGKQYAKRGDFDSAARAYHVAINLDPENATAYAELGRLYLQAGDVRLAGTHLRKAYQLNAAEPGVAADLERVYATRDSELASDNGQ